MNQLDYFKKFIPKDDSATEQTNFQVWSYTRVSSKDQFEKNSSVDNQRTTNQQYATNFKLNIVEEFGGTYESGKSDFTRKEFKRLIDKVEKSRRKPYAILVFKMSRFSRSGGNAIGLVNHLVETLGVHLIETSSGITTTSERGKASIYESLFHAYKENLERKEIIIPNMKSFLKKGFRFGSAPLGYDHFGPRVKREGFMSTKQRIIINKDGEILREAWNWKASGLYSDVQIIAKLQARGIDILQQKLSKIWRNPFYCGILVSKMLDEPIMGNWEPLISIELFKKVQDIIDDNPCGYNHNPYEDKRPLARVARCIICDGYLTGYEVKAKGIHYYKCPRCVGINVNANSTARSKRTGVNDVFKDFLTGYALEPSILPLLEMQLTKIFKQQNELAMLSYDRIVERKKTVQEQLKAIKIRHALNEIDKDTYQLTHDHLMEKLAQVEKELPSFNTTISNLDNLIKKSLEKAANLNKIWDSSGLEQRQNMCRILFPGGIFYDAKKHAFLTKRENGFLALTHSLSNVYTENKNGTSQELLEKSLSVAGSGVEPETFGL